MKPSKQKKDEEFDHLQKIIIIGDSGVGKSNILLRYSEGKFVDNFMMTIGINYVFKIVQIEGIKIKMQIWDTAGQDKYKTITQNYYRNSHGVLIVFSVDSKDSFYSVRNWIQDLQNLTQNTQVMLVGNKMDLIETRQVSFEQAKEVASQNNMKYMQCSAKSGESVQQVFQCLGKLMKQKFIDGPVEDKDGKSGTIPLNKTGSSLKQKCCNS